jgi:hypothetical protein
VRHKLAVTISGRRDEALRERAMRAAEEISVPFLPRHHKEPLQRLLEEEAEVLVVFEASAVCLVDRQGTLRFSPGLAHLRIKQLDRGVHEDMLLRVSGIREGDQVLDCTLGLAGDAQVAARLVGPGGTVTGLESSPGLFLLARHGLQGLARHPQSCAIQVVHAEATAYLSALPAQSFDLVLFDPMFERKRKSSNAFELLRRHADDAPLTREALAQAQRVARRAVVLKGSRYSSDFKKLGVKPEPARPNATVLWAKLLGGVHAV